MIEFLVAIVAFVFVLGFIVTLHELGHFYFAKKAGILCSEFAIGMGPVIYRVKKGETYYAIRALPIGGFVSMAGEDLNENLVQPGMKVSLQLENNLITEIILDPKVEGNVEGLVINSDLYGIDSNDLFIELNINSEVKKYNIAEECYYVTNGNQKMLLAPYGRCFESKTLPQRFLTIVAGPVMNLILALALFLVVGLATGVPTNENIIGEVSTNTAQLYLKENDKVIEIDGMKINTWDEIGIAMDAVEKKGSFYIPMTVIRNEEEIQVNIKATIQILSIGITNLNNGEDEETPYEGPGILLGEIPNGNKAAEAGLKKGDALLSITLNEKQTSVNSWSELMNYFNDNTSGEVKFTYSRDGEVKTTKSVEIFNDETLKKLEMPRMTYTIGISATTEFNLLGGIKNGFDLTISNAMMIFTTLGMMLNPSAQLGVSDLSGPVGIFGIIQSYIGTGFINFLGLIAMLSINFFVVNLLPLPALDGGRLVFLGYEAITKKKVDKKIENTITMIGFAIMMILMLYVTFNDLLRI